MVTTCIYKGLLKGKIDRLYLSCLPFGYLGVFLLLHFGTNLSAGYICGIALLIGDAPGALLTAIVAGFLALLSKPGEHPESTIQKQ